MLFENCGLTADNLAKIIKGIADMQDIKALIVKKEIFNQQCVDNIVGSLRHHVPYHLDELSIIECRISPFLIESLMQLLTTESRLRKFTLVKVQHNERSFDSLVEYVRCKIELKELDLSW